MLPGGHVSPHRRQGSSATAGAGQQRMGTAPQQQVALFFSMALRGLSFQHRFWSGLTDGSLVMFVAHIVFTCFFPGIPTFMVVVTPHLSWGVWIDVFRGSKWIPEEIGFCWLKQIQELLVSRWIFIKSWIIPPNIFNFFHYKNGSARACIKADVRVMMLVFTNQLPWWWGHQKMSA